MGLAWSDGGLMMKLRQASWAMHVTGGMFEPNGTTSMPNSVPRLVVDKVKLLNSSEMFITESILLDVKVIPCHVLYK